MNTNIKYTTADIEEYYKQNRIHWDQFYESEKTIISKLDFNEKSSILDIGCGCAGLGNALKEKYGVTDYTGVEIHSGAAAYGKKLLPSATMIDNDIMKISQEELPYNSFDFVFSLSAVDFNLMMEDMLKRAMDYVKPGGYLIGSFRLTTEETLLDMETSYQYINFEGKKEGELAPYVLINIDNFFDFIEKLGYSDMKAYGFWGKPSATAVTPPEKILFIVIALQKNIADNKKTYDLQMPDEIKQKITNSL